MNIKDKYNIIDNEYFEYIKEIIESDQVKKMDNYIQHGYTTTLKHSLDVSYKSYILAKKLKFNYKAVARAGLLHDFYLYDWHELDKEKNFFKKHGYSHPTIALKNAKKSFDISSVECDIIEKHMWPLTIRKIPRYKESLLVSIVDKYISTKETIYPYLVELRKYVYI